LHTFPVLPLLGPGRPQTSRTSLGD
jgi:hypothetical protein